MTSELFPLYAPARLAARTHNGWLWLIALLAFTAFAIVAPPFALGSKIEAKLFPILSHQDIPAASVSRVDRSLCWTWERNKARAPEVLDLDVTLDTADGDSYAPEIFSADTGVPWHKGGALPAGHYLSQFCTTIPALIPHDMSVRLRQAITYQGFMGLWIIRVVLPSVVAN